jgi:hypothetical protein
MATVTLTEFNRNPSRVAKIARSEDVIITDHGVATLEVRRIDAHDSRLDQLRRAGQVRPARDRSLDPFPDFGLDRDVADRLFADFEAERDQRDY